MAQHDRRKEKAVQTTIGNAVSGTIYLIIIQVASRALTFAGNQFTLRYISPQILGIAVQLELYSVSVLYFSRESLRVALQRESSCDNVASPIDSTPTSSSSAQARQTQVVVNLSYLAVGLGVLLTIALGWIYYQGQSSNIQIQQTPFFSVSLQICAVATLIELLSEPCFVVVQKKLLYSSRARIETVAALSKCTTTCLIAYIADRKQLPPSVLPFAVGQTVYALVLIGGYLATVLPVARQDGVAMLPRIIESSSQYVASRFYRPVVSLAATLYTQSVFKQILTQGDALILGLLASLEDQGAFALASNYGGLMARLIFQPVEESSRNAFGSLLSRMDKDGKVEPDCLKVAIRHLNDMLHLYGIVAVLSTCFLYTLLPLLVKVLVGRVWFTPDVAGILSTYCYYIPFMAYNGILDAFVTSVATPVQLQQQSIWMGAFTMGYIGAAYLLLTTLDLGARGLVLGNIFNMFMRILWSSWFITQYMKKQHGERNMLKDLLPKPGIFLVGTVAAGIMRRGDLENRQGIGSTLYVLVVCALGGSAILFLERDFLLGYLSSILPERIASRLKLRRTTNSKDEQISYRT